MPAIYTYYMTKPTAAPSASIKLMEGRINCLLMKIKRIVKNLQGFRKIRLQKVRVVESCQYFSNYVFYFLQGMWQLTNFCVSDGEDENREGDKNADFLPFPADQVDVGFFHFFANRIFGVLHVHVGGALALIVGGRGRLQNLSWNSLLKKKI